MPINKKINKMNNTSKISTKVETMPMFTVPYPSIVHWSAPSPSASFA